MTFKLSKEASNLLNAIESFELKYPNIIPALSDDLISIKDRIILLEVNEQYE